MSTQHNMLDYDQTYREFKWEVPERFNFARDRIDKFAEDPQKLALFWVDDEGHEKKLTFAELSASSRRIANLLARQGVKRGGVVIVVLGRYLEWWQLFTACIRMGAVIAPGTTQLTSKDLVYRINTAEAVAFVTDNANAPKLEAIADQCPSLKTRIIVGGQRQGWVDLEAGMAAASEEFITADTRHDENCLLYFTSGTVGFPKMALHTHTSYPLGHEVTGRFWLDLKLDDLHWNISDTGWAKAAWSSFFGPWSCGSAMFVHFTDRFDPKKTLELLQKYPITTMCGAPTIYRMLVLQDLKKYKFPTLRHCVGAGEPLNPEIIDVWKKATGCTIRDGYGQTETVLLCGSFPCIAPKFGSMGKPTPGFEVAVIDHSGDLLPPGTEGDIAVRVKPQRPVGLFKEYWKDPDRTASVHRGDWYLTGDRARVDKDGYFWFIGRADDVIKTSGERVGPFEVESALVAHPAVVEAGVIGKPDPIRGEIIKAFIVLSPEYKEKVKTKTQEEALQNELSQYVKKHLAGHAYPREVEIMDKLPKTRSGKIMRRILKAKELGLPIGDTSTLEDY